MNTSVKRAVDRLLRPTASLAALALSLVASTAAHAAFTFDGVSAGDADTSSVLFWTRALDKTNGVDNTAGSSNTSINLQICSDTNFVSGVTVLTTNTVAINDYTAKIDVTGLASGTTYYYRWVETNSGATSIIGKVKTAPSPTGNYALHFAFSGDMDGLMRPYALSSQVPRENLDFYFNCGDTIYETASASHGNIGLPYTNSPAVTATGVIPAPAASGATQAQLSSQFSAKYDQQFFPVNTGGQNGLQAFYAGQANYSLYDNHELGNKQYINGGAPAGGVVGDMTSGAGVDARLSSNDAADTNGTTVFMNQSTGFQTLQKTFIDHMAIADRGTISAPTDPRMNGTRQLYFSQRWGRNAIFFDLDDRTYRDIRMKTSANVDDTGSRADNPDRTYLGKTQLAWLKSQLLAAQKAGVIWKFIGISNPLDQIGPIGGSLTLSNAPANPGTYLPVISDGGKAYFGEYRAERNNLLKFIADNGIVNVVFLTTDDHQNRVNELTYSTNGQTANQSTYVKVPYCFHIVCGPLGATGPDLETNHSYSGYIKPLADSIYNAQVAAGIEPLGLMGYPGLTNVTREFDGTNVTTPQAVDFYSPDTFNYNVLDVSKDGSTLTVTSRGITSTAQNSAMEYDSANNPVRTIFSFQVKAAQPSKLSQIDHIIVVYQENWSFDALYGSFPGANGINNASPTSLAQIDRVSGNLLSSLTGAYNNVDYSVSAPYGAIPLPLATNITSGVIGTDKAHLDSHFPTALNTLLPYLVSDYLAASINTSDIVHKYWQEALQINKGKNNAFVTFSDNPGLVMSRFDASSMPEGLLAQQYTMCDNFFHSAFGGSYLNAQFLITANTPIYANMPTNNNGAIAVLDANGKFALNTSGSRTGKFVRDGSITPVAGDVLTGLNLNGSTQTITVAPNNLIGSDFVYVDGTRFTNHYTVNTTFSQNLVPNFGSVSSVGNLPSLNNSNPSDSTRPYVQTIGDLLDNAGLTWKWYSGGFDRALAVSPANPAHYGTNGVDPALTTNPTLAAAYPIGTFQWHHQCFAYYDKYAPFVSTNVYASNPSAGSFNTNSSAHLQDLDAHFYSDVASTNLPAVSFVKFMGPDNEHPGYASLQQGQQAVANLVAAVSNNPTLWAHTAIIITYDEHGGRFDHVTPPVRDIWGPGVRVPCIVISPFARKGYVDHTQYDTTSILKTIEQNFGLGTMGNPGNLDAKAPSLAGIFTDNSVSASGYVYNRAGNTFNQTITVKNNGAVPMVAPICIAFDSLSTNTSVKGALGTTINSVPTGSSYILISSSDLAPGASASGTVSFTRPATGGISYTPRVIVGSRNP